MSIAPSEVDTKRNRSGVDMRTAGLTNELKHENEKWLLPFATTLQLSIRNGMMLSMKPCQRSRQPGIFVLESRTLNKETKAVSKLSDGPWMLEGSIVRHQNGTVIADLTNARMTPAQKKSVGSLIAAAPDLADELCRVISRIECGEDPEIEKADEVLGRAEP